MDLNKVVESIGAKPGDGRCVLAARQRHGREVRRWLPFVARSGRGRREAAAVFAPPGVPETGDVRGLLW
jgi:hypothetical protein